MDALSGLLDGPRARGAFLLRAVMDPPWSILIRDEAPLSVVSVLKGHAWVVPRDGEARQVFPGDVVIMRGPDPYVFADVPETAPQIVIDPGQRCTTLDGEELAESFNLGIRTWGNSADGGTVMLVGTYETHGAVSRRLLHALPTTLVLPGAAVDSPLVPMLGEEVTTDAPGQEAVLDRLLDLLLIAVLRVWFDRPEADAPTWYRAHGDPVVGRALQLLHNNPAHPWTVERLAAECGVSRATLARRFTILVGEGPMTFLTGWRLALAADLLRESDATVTAVARQVGYSTGFALSAAFKRVLGVSPTQLRT